MNAVFSEKRSRRWVEIKGACAQGISGLPMPLAHFAAIFVTHNHFSSAGAARQRRFMPNFCLAAPGKPSRPTRRVRNGLLVFEDVIEMAVLGIPRSEFRAIQYRHSHTGLWKVSGIFFRFAGVILKSTGDSGGGSKLGSRAKPSLCHRKAMVEQKQALQELKSEVSQQ